MRLLSFLKHIRMLGLISFAGISQASADVRINEVMASNGSIIADEDGDFEDWIELINTGENQIDLSGWGLSDNPGNPFKWVFPGGVFMEPGDFLLVWTSGKDRNTPADLPLPLVPRGAEWLYWDAEHPPAGWMSPAFDEAGAGTGSAPLGYGGTYETNTELADGADPVFFRKSFTVADPARFTALELELAGRQGFIVHVNGVEAARHLFPDGPLAPETPASPIPTGDLTLWTAADRETVTRVEGGSTYVSQWTDLSGNGHHLFQATASHQPELVENAINGLPALRLNGGNHHLLTQNIPTGGEITVFIVAKPEGGGPSARIFSKGSDAGGIMLMRNDTPHNVGIRIDTPAGFNQFRAGGPLFDSAWHHIGISTSEERVRMKVDGSPRIDHAYEWGEGIASNRPFVLGANYVANAAFMQGEIAEVIVYNRSLSEGERTIVESYLNSKYGRPAVVPEVKISVDPELLVAGTNVITVEARQPDHAYPGLHFDLSLSALYPGRSLHTNYSISSAGEALLLSRPDQSPADMVPATAIPHDVSYGRQPDGTGGWFFFDKATPWGSNTTIAFPEVLEPPSFSHEAGFHTGDFDLSLTHPDSGVTIVYTLDGSDPMLEKLDGDGFFYKNEYPYFPGDPFGEQIFQSFRSNVYTASIPIGNRSEEANQVSIKNTKASTNNLDLIPENPVFKGNIVRAVATKPGSLPSRISTKTYFVTPEGSSRYALPVYSLVTEEKNLFDYESGIYTAGKHADDYRLWNPGAEFIPREDANFGRTGRDWERPVHMEIFEPDGGFAFSRNVGMRIAGGGSRPYARKSLRLFPRSRYDSSDLIAHPVIPDLKARGTGEPIESFSRLMLRNSGQDANRTLLRDALAQVAIEPLGLDQQGYQPAIHFINGEFWGMIEIRESTGTGHLASHYGIDEEDIAILRRNAVVSDGEESDRDDYLSLVEYMENNDLSVNEHYAHVTRHIDIRNLANYKAAQIYSRNLDWPHNNIDFWRVKSGNPSQEGVRDGRWRWIVYDMDITFLGPSYRYLESSLGLDDPPALPPYSTVLLKNLIQNEDFRNLFLNTFADQMATIYVPSRIHAILDDIHGKIGPYYEEHIARWPDMESTEISGYRDFIDNRPDFMRQEILDVFGLSGTSTISLDVSDPAHGKLRINSIVVDEDTPGLPDPEQPYPWSGIYFQGVPVTITALPEPGYRFAGWAELPDETSPEIEVTLTADAAFTALFEEAPPEPPVFPLHHWTFNTPGTFLQPDFTVGGGSVNALPGPATEILSDTGGDFPDRHLRVNNPEGAELIFQLPTTGYEDITLSFDMRRSGQGAAHVIVSHTTDGMNFIEPRTLTAFDDFPVPRNIGFADVEGVADNPLFAVRITFGSGGTAGNNRFDNVLVRGRVLPGVNQPPIFDPGALPSGSLGLLGGKQSEVNLNELFNDPDGDPLAFSATSSHGSVAAVSVENGILSVSALSTGETRITIEAGDGENPPVPASFIVLVYPEAHVLADGDFAFTEWDTQSPAGTFPPNMIFLQTEVADPPLGAALSRAYHIPPADADSPADVVLPYAATSRSRINGLGEDGIAFINTGREYGRDVGAALVTLDTTGLTQAGVGFAAGTMVENLRTYAIRLQYRVGTEDDFQDLPDAFGNPVEYVRSAAGDMAEIGPVALPEEALDQPCVQLLWRYYYISGSGARAQLRLDDIFITSEAPEPPPELVSLHHWTFDAEETYLTPDHGIGGGSIVTLPNPSVDFVWNEEAQDFTSGHLRVNNPLGKTLTFHLPTTGHETINLSFDARRSGSGAGLAYPEYTLDGETFIPLETIIVYDTAPRRKFINFSEIAGAADNPHFAVQITFGQGDGGVVGNMRFDNVSLRGSVMGGGITEFAAWQEAEFPDETERNDPLVGGPLADPTGSGVNNLLRYALGLGRSDNPHPLLPKLERGEHGMVLRFPFDPAKSDLIYRVARSENLSNWEEKIFDSTTDDWENLLEEGWLHVADPEESEEGRAFYRLEVDRRYATGFAAWQEAEFPDEAERNDPLVGGPLADPTASGVNNLLRYALGLGRSDNPHPLLPKLEHGEHGMVFRFPFDPAKSDLIYRVACSKNLSNWEEKIFDSTTDDWENLLEDGWLHVADPGGSEEGRAFYRLEVEQR